MSIDKNETKAGTPLAEPTGSAIMVSHGDKLAKGDEYLCDNGTWKTLDPIWIGVTYTKWLMVPMRRPNTVILKNDNTGRPDTRREPRCLSRDVRRDWRPI